MRRQGVDNCWCAHPSSFSNSLNIASPAVCSRMDHVGSSEPCTMSTRLRRFMWPQWPLALTTEHGWSLCRQRLAVKLHTARLSGAALTNL